MFNPLNLGVFRLMFHVGEVYFFSTRGMCVFLSQGKVLYTSKIFIACPEGYQKFNPLNLGGFRTSHIQGKFIYIMFFDESVFFRLQVYFTCRNVFLLSCDVFLNHHSPTRYFHLHTLTCLQQTLTFVMHQMLQRGWYYTIMHPPSTICCLILGLIRLFSWDIPRPRVFSLDIPTRALGIYEDITHALGIYEDNTLRTGYIRGQYPYQSGYGTRYQYGHAYLSGQRFEHYLHG